MNYAIIKSTVTSLLEVIRLNDWSAYEWDDFSTVKSKEDNEIVWFWTEEEATEWMIEKFHKSLINQRYFKVTSIDGEYYID